MPGATHYDILGVSPNADAVALRKAYLHQARMHHPDFHAVDGQREDAEERMRLVNEAWAVVGDTTSRERYDRDLRLSGRLSSDGAAPAANRRPPPADAFADAGSYTTPPKWITVAPALALVCAFGSFVVGFMTGLAPVLAAGLVFAMLGAILFLIAPMVALARSKRDDGGRGHVSGRNPSPSPSTRKRRPA